MKYFPIENITYKTKLDSEEILKRLGEIIEPKKTMRMTGIFGDGNHRPYEGNIKGRTFNINRIISYRNSFLPRISGFIEDGINGSKINVKMRLHLSVIIFMFIWFGAVGFACIAILLIKLESEIFHAMSLIPFGMLIFGYALVTGGFKYESIKSKKNLAELFEAEIEE